MPFLTGTNHPKQRVPGQQHLLCVNVLMLPGLQPQPGSRGCSDSTATLQEALNAGNAQKFLLQLKEEENVTAPWGILAPSPLLQLSPYFHRHTSKTWGKTSSKGSVPLCRAFSGENV